MKKILIITVLIIAALSFAGCDDYTLKTTAEPGSVSPGSGGKLTISYKAHGKYHLDPDGMALITFEPPAGIVVEKPELRQEDKIAVGKFETKFIVAPTAAKGVSNIVAKIMFQLCTKELCKLINEERQIPIKIE